MTLFAVARELFPFAVALYFIEALIYVRAGWAMLSLSSGRNVLRSPGIRMVGAFPWRHVFILKHMNVISGINSVFFISRKARPGNLYTAGDYQEMKYGEISSVMPAGSDLFVNSRKAASFPSRLSARNAAANLKALSRADETERSRLIKKNLEASFDTGEVSRRRAFLDGSLFILTMLCMSFFCILFLVFPLAFYADRWWHPDMILLLTTAGVLSAAILVLSAFKFHEMFSKGFSDSVMFILPFMLYPIAVPQILAAFNRHAYEETSLFAVTAEFFDDDSFEDIALRELLRLNASMAQAGNDNFAGALGFHRDALSGFLADRGIGQDKKLKPPERGGSVATAYCPLCDTQFVEGHGTCSECNITLEPYTDN